MGPEELLAYVKNGGAYCSPLLLLALLWMNQERSRLVKDLEAKNLKLETLSERTIAVMTELKTFLFSGRRP